MDVLLVGAVGLGGLYAIAKSEKENKKKETMRTIGKIQKQASNPASNLNYAENNNATEMYADQAKFQRIHNTTAGYKQQLTNNSAYSPDDEITPESEQKKAQKLPLVYSTIPIGLLAPFDVTSAWRGAFSSLGPARVAERTHISSA